MKERNKFSEKSDDLKKKGVISSPFSPIAYNPGPCFIPYISFPRSLNLYGEFFPSNERTKFSTKCRGGLANQRPATSFFVGVSLAF